MRQYYRAVFRTDGVAVAVRNAAVVEPPWHRRHWLPGGAHGRICCRGVTANFDSGGLHVLADIDGVAAASLLAAISGRGPLTTGEVWIDGREVAARDRARLVAYVEGSSLFIPLLSVESNLWFVVHLRRRETRSLKRELVLAVANFAHLDLLKRVDDLSRAEKFRLQVALELVLDPPVLFLSYPFRTMTLEEQLQCTHLLSRICTDMAKTVVLSTQTLPMPLHGAADTLLLFGAVGHVLFSGKAREAVPYFNRLRIPRHVAAPLWKGVLAPLSDAPTEAGATEDLWAHSTASPAPSNATSATRRCVDTPSNRLFSALCTPPRLSSRFMFADAVDDAAAASLFYAVPHAHNGTTTPRAVVEVATSGDLIDLAVEWAESESQTMFYAAKYFDSSTHAALLVTLEGAIAAAATQVMQPTSSRAPQASPGWMWRFGVLLTYTVRQIAVDAELLVGLALLSIGLIFLTVVVHVQPESQGGMFNIRGLIFIAFVLVLFTNLVAIDSARDQLRVAFGHRRRRLYGAVSFMTCLTIRALLVRAAYLALLLPFFVFVMRSSYALALLIGLVSCTHAALQYVIALLPSRRWAVCVSYLCFGYNIVFSGFLLNLRTIPSWIGVLSFLRWGYGAVLHTWLHGKKFQCDGAGNTSYCYTGDDYLAVEGLQDDSVGGAALFLTVSGATLMGVFLLLWLVRPISQAQ